MCVFVLQTSEQAVPLSYVLCGYVYMCVVALQTSEQTVSPFYVLCGYVYMCVVALQTSEQTVSPFYVLCGYVYMCVFVLQTSEQEVSASGISRGHSSSQCGSPLLRDPHAVRYTTGSGRHQEGHHGYKA